MWSVSSNVCGTAGVCVRACVCVCVCVCVLWSGLSAAGSMGRQELIRTKHCLALVITSHMCMYVLAMDLAL